jgi:hypothetical protein
MIVVRVEVWPFGDEDAKRTVGTATIANDGTGDFLMGSYDVKLFKAGSDKVRGRKPWRQGRVDGFPRRRLGAFDLLLRALKASIGDRP